MSLPPSYEETIEGVHMFSMMICSMVNHLSDEKLLDDMMTVCAVIKKHYLNALKPSSDFDPKKFDLLYSAMPEFWKEETETKMKSVCNITQLYDCLKEKNIRFMRNWLCCCTHSNKALTEIVCFIADSKEELLGIALRLLRQ